MDIRDWDELADLMVAAHDGGPLIDSVPPELIPQDLAGIVALQDKVIQRLGPVGGWKVVAGAEGVPSCAPIPQSRYFDNDSFVDGKHHRFVIAEVEVAVALASDIPPGSDRAAVEQAIGGVHLVLEMVGSPFIDRDLIDRRVTLGDLQSNGAVIVGPAFAPKQRGDFTPHGVELAYDGEAIADGSGGASWDAILDALVWLAGHAADRNMPLTAGNVSITGARLMRPRGEVRRGEGRAGGLTVGVQLSRG